LTSPSHITEPIRSACRAVAESAAQVKIDTARIRDYAGSLPLTGTAPPTLDPEFHWLGHGADTAAFIITLNTINFGSGYFPHLRKRGDRSGYFTIAGALTDYFRIRGKLNAHNLIALTVADCLRIFGQDPENETIRELMQHFTLALNQLGGYLAQNFNGSFTALIHSAERSTDKLIRRLIRMPYFNDTHPYGLLEVPFHKRAQLTASDLSLAFGNRGLGEFADLDQLTIFADNLVPHVLRMDGLLSYDSHLSERIQAAELIPAGSPEEIEIRACAVHAVECIKHELHRWGHRVTSRMLDYLLWNRGQQPVYKAVARHRTRSVYY
jgi:hypothetical protein